MYQHDKYTRDGEVIHTAQSESDAAEVRAGRPNLPLTVTIGDVDLPAFLSNGEFYIQAPLPLIFEAFAEDISAFIRDLEVRVSGKRSGALSLSRDGRPLFGASVAKSRMVRGGRK